MARLATVGLLLLVLLAAASGGGRVATPALAATNPCGMAGKPKHVYHHVIWIWMENSSYDDVIGNAAAPNISGYAAQCGSDAAWLDDVLPTPSLPNYIAASAGGNCSDSLIHRKAPAGVSCILKDGIPDAAGAPRLAVRTIYDQVADLPGGTWRGYAESMTQPCQTVNAPPYVARHNPPPYFSSLTSCSANDVTIPTLSCTQGTGCATPTSGALRDDAVNGTLPTFATVTPNLCHDMHDSDENDAMCNYDDRVAAGDDWLAAWLPVLTGGPNYAAGDTAIFVAWDESSSAVYCKTAPGVYPAACSLPALVIAPTVTPGERSVLVNNVGMLRTTEQMLGITERLGCAAGGKGCRPGSTTSLRSAFHM